MTTSCLQSLHEGLSQISIATRRLPSGPSFARKGAIRIFTLQKKLISMSLLNQQNNKGKKKGNKKSGPNNAQGSKFIQKAKSSAGFVSKQQNTGSQRGS